MVARQYTEDEVREKLLRHIWHMIDWWENESRRPETRDKLEGLAFSILAALDGSNLGLPSFIVAPLPHPDDREYLAAQGENWFPENKVPIICDLGGSLHELFYNFKPGVEEEDTLTETR